MVNRPGESQTYHNSYSAHKRDADPARGHRLILQILQKIRLHRNRHCFTPKSGVSHPRGAQMDMSLPPRCLRQVQWEWKTIPSVGTGSHAG